MSFGSRLKNNQAALAATALTGNTGTVVAGNSLQSKDIQPGTLLCAQVAFVLSTATLTIAPSWQGSLDGSTWLDLYTMNSAANVTMTASGTKTITVPAPLPFRYVRCVATTGGITATAGDTVAIRYHYVANGY